MRSLRYLLPALALLSPVAGFAAPYTGQASAYNVCASLTFDSDKNDCLRVLSQGWVSPEIVPVCLAETFSSDKIDCLKKSLNHDFEADAVRVCQRMTFSSDRQDCLATIADHVFEPAALRMCDGMTFSSDKMDCLKQSRQPMRRYRRDYPRAGNANDTAAIILDALDQILRDVILTYGTNQGGSICSVVNSNETFLGEVSETQLVSAGQDFARQQDSCVVTNVKGATRTRTLIDAQGRVIGQGLTEKEAQKLKKRYGYSRCRVMTCERE